MDEFGPFLDHVSECAIVSSRRLLLASECVCVCVCACGLVSAGEMARAGLAFNAMAIVAITLYMPLAARLALG